MAPAPKGHPLWGNPIKPKKYTPEEFWEGACNYFEWCDDNPLTKKDFIRSGHSAGEIVDLKVKRAYSIEGLCVFLNITTQTYYNYSKAENYETYFDICHTIKNIIDSQHFENGMVEIFNPGIVTRKLGLAEKQDLNHSGAVVWKEEKTYEAEQKTNKSN